MSKNFDPRTGTVSLLPIKRISNAPRKQQLSSSGPERGLIIQRTQEEMTRIEREKALNDELMTLGLFGEMQDEPQLEVVFRQIQEEVSTEVLPEVIIEVIEAPPILTSEVSTLSKKGRRRKKS